MICQKAPFSFIFKVKILIKLSHKFIGQKKGSLKEVLIVFITFASIEYVN